MEKRTTIRDLCPQTDPIRDIFGTQVDVSPPVDYELLTAEDKRAGWVFAVCLVGVGTVLAGVFTGILLALPHLHKLAKWVGGFF